MRKALIAIPLVALALGAAAPAASAIHPPPPVFHRVAEGFVSSKFRPRRDGNRVFYAASLKASRPWLPFTRVHIPAPFFTRAGLLAIFYRELPPGVPTVEGVKYAATDSRAIEVEVTLYPLCGYICLPSLWDSNTGQDGAGWGRFVLEAIDKSFLPVAPERISVTESVYQPPPPCGGTCVVPLARISNGSAASWN